MDEGTWPISTNPLAMMAYLRERCRPSNRKMALWCVALRARIGPPDGLTNTIESREEWGNLAADVIPNWVDGYLGIGEPDDATKAALLRDIFGNPFRPVVVVNHPRTGQYWGTPHVHSVLRDDVPGSQMPPGAGPYGVLDYPCITQAVLSVAAAIYHERAFDRLPVLADALEEAGCTEDATLRHLRGQERCPECFNASEGVRVYCDCGEQSGRMGWIPLRGPHVRGCFCLDLLLGKE